MLRGRWRKKKSSAGRGVTHRGRVRREIKTKQHHACPITRLFPPPLSCPSFVRHLLPLPALIDRLTALHCSPVSFFLSFFRPFTFEFPVRSDASAHAVTSYPIIILTS